MTIPYQLQDLLEHDCELATLWKSKQKLKDEEQAKKLLTHLKSKEYLVSRHDLTAIFGKNGGYLSRLLEETSYQPLQCSTGEELELAIKSTSFIANQWLPRGHVTALVSTPGLGKTYVALEVARILTTEQPTWFDRVTPVDAKSRFVVWCEAEGFQAGLKERIEQLEIPPERIILPFEDPLVDFRLELHFVDLQDAVAYYEPDLVVIDSLRAAHGKQEKGSKDMQEIMSKLVTVAKQFNVAVIINHHTNKPAPGQKDLVDINRVRGSSVIAANCRMIWGLERPDPKDKTVCLKVVKSNLASFPKPLGLIITDGGVEWTEAPISDEEYAGEHRRKNKEELAADWLTEFLKDGPKPSKEVQSEGEEAGHSWATLRRASKGLVNNLSRDKDHKYWRWTLADAHSSQSNRDERVNNYEQVEHV